MNYISLGYFCSISMDLGKLGLRKESSPFDWLISDFKGVIDAIENRFDGFLEYEDLLQSRTNRAHYKNERYGFEFYHEFDPCRPLTEQLPAVQEKYGRRIRRFYETIKEPTLFIRYISDEVLEDGKSAELIWIEKHYDRILALLKSFNAYNEILFIANCGVASDVIKIYNVQKDRNDTVCRHPLFNNFVLLEYFQAVDFPDRELNIRFYEQGHAKSLRRKIAAKAFFLLPHSIRKEYIHQKQY